MEGDRKTALQALKLYHLLTTIPQVYYVGTFQTFQIQCHVRKILFISGSTSMVPRAIYKYYLINSTKVDRLKTLHLCSR